MQDAADDVGRWLQSRPFRDNPERVAPAAGQPYGSWYEWIEKGRQIPDVESRLIHIARNDTDAVNRSEAALALGLVGSGQSVGSLIASLESDVALVAMEAAASLGRLGSADAIEPLCAALRHADANVRANACTSLGLFDDERAVSCLKDAEKDADPFVQAAAKEALRRKNEND